MIYGIGTDIVAAERFTRFLNEGNTAIIERIFTPAEQERCHSRKDTALCLAARFAAKEAFLKALGTGLRDGISWQDIEICNDELGKPFLNLSGSARSIVNNRSICTPFLTIAHDGGYAIATVVLEVP